jgi:hypothetical protein
MGRTIATSGGLTWESSDEALWSHNLFTRRATSDDRVLFPEPGGPAKPTMYLYGILGR